MERTGGKLLFCLVFCCTVHTVSLAATAATTAATATTTTPATRVLLQQLYNQYRDNYCAKAELQPHQVIFYSVAQWGSFHDLPNPRVFLITLHGRPVIVSIFISHQWASSILPHSIQDIFRIRGVPY